MTRDGQGHEAGERTTRPDHPPEPPHPSIVPVLAPLGSRGVAFRSLLLSGGTLLVCRATRGHDGELQPNEGAVGAEYRLVRTRRAGC